MPPVTIGFNIQFAVATKQREIKTIVAVIDLQVILPFCGNLQSLEFRPQQIFKRAFIVKIVDLNGLRKFLSCRGNENNAPKSPAENRCGQTFQRLEQ